jgi:Uncharacterized conserved protein
MRFRIPSLLVMVAATMVAAGVQAQTPVKAGDSIPGMLGPNSPSLSDGTRYECFLLPTTPGSRWIIESPSSFDSVLNLGIGDDCSNARWIRADDDGLGNLDARMVFNAGGGAYLLRLRGFNNQHSGTYTLNVRQEPGEYRRGMMAAGSNIVIAPERVGTASTTGQGAGALAAGEILQDCPSCPSMVVVPAGSYMMGSPASEENREGDEGPRHLVTLNRAFAIGRYEVTFDEYDACVAANGCRAVSDQSWGRGRRPVINVTYDDAQRYVAWLSQTTGHDYFLPSEAEWEYAARAGTDTPWPTGSAVITDDANILNQFQKTVVVGGYPSNAFGLHDTMGNVGEWVQDCLDAGYVGAPTDGSAARSGDCAGKTIIRGGYFTSEPKDVRSARRFSAARRQSWQAVGFRVTRAM